MSAIGTIFQIESASQLFHQTWQHIQLQFPHQVFQRGIHFHIPVVCYIHPVWIHNNIGNDADPVESCAIWILDKHACPPGLEAIWQVRNHYIASGASGGLADDSGKMIVFDFGKK